MKILNYLKTKYKLFKDYELDDLHADEDELNNEHDDSHDNEPGNSNGNEHENNKIGNIAFDFAQYFG